MTFSVSDRETKREALIRQFRTALNDLQAPSFFDYNESITFTIDEMEFEYTEEDLENFHE